METGLSGELVAPEEWRVCTISPEYEVSSLGRIRSLDRVIKKKNGVMQKRVGQMIKPGLCNRKGKQYHFVVIKKVPTLLHRLIALAFLPNPENKRTVDHLDNDRLNNNITNLAWKTHSENNCNKIKKPASGHNMIEWRERDKCFYLKKRTAGKYVINKSFKTLDEALVARKQLLGF